METATAATSAAAGPRAADRLRELAANLETQRGEHEFDGQPVVHGGMENRQKAIGATASAYQERELRCRITIIEKGDFRMATASITSTAAVDPDALYEVVNGEIVETEPMSAYATLIASLLLQAFAGQQGRGRAVAEMLFDFSGSVGTKRRPDLAFVSYDRWAKETPVPDIEAWNVVPSLAVEVVSPSNTAREVVDKLVEYFQAGVERVWVIYPSQRQIYAYSSPTDVKVLSQGDELADDAILTGFHLPLRTLFDDTAAGK